MYIRILIEYIYCWDTCLGMIEATYCGSHNHIIRELVGKGDVLVQKVASADNMTDPLTKALTQL